jgi:uncharacterized membrane protein HdeD (DUF308 family)
MTTNTSSPRSAFSGALRNLYFIRFAFALVWAVLLILTASVGTPLLTVLVFIYPLVDAIAVFWQLRSEGSAQASRVPEWINVALSVVAAIVLAVVSTSSVGAVLAVWGVWAVTAGAVQLIAAILRRRLGGQIPLIVSGAISILAGFAFAGQGAQGASSATGIGGYAILGGVFFLIAAIRLSVLNRRAS